MQPHTEVRSLVRSYGRTSKHKIANQIRLTGWMMLWVQLALALVSGLLLLFTYTGRDFVGQSNPGLGIGIFWAVTGILLLLFSVFWDFRYTRIGRRLDNPNPTLHPSKTDTITAIRMGIVVSLVGMLLTILGSGTSVSLLVAKVVSQPPGVAIISPNKIIRGMDVFIVVANINGIAAHYIGAVASMWLLEKVHQH
ncbi:DUF3611 family protein [Umezakia ovalisporum]|jgi:hypothetical protein|uniref:DUF3611 family protein n=1 Tax=Umezakia ovalisporum TaxID=75695 RepID=UPI00247705EF|nr:DUF3611 family protein [Umezakia ovalisporum]MBI1242411.1 DUF3611 family protein [Nostoc sp. RI_552]MDH6089879.1 DUF3611 family protein [Umezakia ovalisporum Ak1311]